ncbi:MAG: type II secretion system protein GspL, partial [Arenicellales bacterium]
FRNNNIYIYMKLIVSTVAPYPWLKLDKNGRPVDKGQFNEKAFLNTFPKEIQSVIGVAPAGSSTFHSVKIPSKRLANIQAAVPYALEESLSEDLDELHFTILDWAPDQPTQVSVIAKQMLKRWVETFSDAGVSLDAIVPELSLLPIHPSSEASVIEQSTGQYAVKINVFNGFACDQETFDYWWSDEANRELNIAVNDKGLAETLKQSGGEKISHWPIGEGFQSWLEHAPDQLNLKHSFLQNAFEPEHLKPKSTWLNVAAGIAAGALILLGASQWFEVNKLQQRYDANQQEIRALFDESFPDQEYLDAPRRQIASLLSISEDNPASEMFQYLLSIATEIMPAHQAKFDEINYRDQQLQVGISAPNFATLEAITTELNKIPDLQAALISSGSTDSGVTGQIKIARIPQDV